MQTIQRFSLSLLIAVSGIGLSHAKFNPATAYVESPEVAAHFPEPNIDINTPAFAPNKMDFTSQVEMEEFINKLTAKTDKLRVKIIGMTQEGRKIPLLIFADPPIADSATLIKNGKPTVLMIAQQHGNEPASGEAALAFADMLATDITKQEILKKVNVLIVPRGNPDGADKFSRDTVDGTNLNRDHLLLNTPEVKSISKVFADYQPEIVLDCHEFTVAERWIDKFGGVQWPDGGIQYSTIANEATGLRALSKIYHQNLLTDTKKHNINLSEYYTTDKTNMSDRLVSMGGVGPDLGRNIAGLRNSISFLLETRGVGLGKAHFKRRVYTHMLAIESILTTTAQNTKILMDTNEAAKQEIINAAGKGNIVVKGKATLSKNTIRLVDVKTAKVMEIDVDWANSLQITPTLERTRPYAYILPASENSSVSRLQDLGVEIYKVTKPIELQVKQYKTDAVEQATKTDVTGKVGEVGNSIIAVNTTLEETKLMVNDSYYYIPLNQPLANLAIVALEPESQSSYVANHILSMPKADADKAIRLPVYRLETDTKLSIELYGKVDR